MNIFKKYCVDDLMLTGNSMKVINTAISILDKYPATGQTYRQKIADEISNIGLIALSKYLLNPSDYETFFSIAKQEQAERLKKRSSAEIEQYPYTSLERKLQEVKKQYSVCQSKYTSNSRVMAERHLREMADLKSRHTQEIEKLKKQNIAELDKIQKEIKEIEHQLKLQNDPEYAAAYHAEQKRKQEERERIEAEKRFLQSFDIDWIANTDRQKLFPILRKLSLSERLSEEEVVWLETTGKQNYFSKQSKVYQTHNRLEAEYYIDVFQKQKIVWHAVNASSHLRKAQLAERAETLLKDITQNKITDKKLKSAFFTTFGGVKRDLDKFYEGIELAETAHELSPKDYRPCTLLGALHFEIREYTTGSEWFATAERLGAPTHNTDAEIKAVYYKANKEKKAELKAYLLKVDPKRYAWVKKSDKKHN